METHPRPHVLRAIVAAAVLTTAHTASAGIMSYTPMAGDADSGINSALTYTAKGDIFGSGTRVVNGVPFTDTGLSGTGYNLTGPGNTLSGGNPNLVTGDVGGMVNDFYYGNAGNASLTLTDLTIGTQYVTTWYNRGWGPVGGRYVFITASDSPDGFFRIDQNFTGDGNGNVIRYTFTATATTQTYTFDAASDGDSFHQYAVSNAVRNNTILPLAGAPVAPRISFQNTPAGPKTASVSNTDLLQTQLAAANLVAGTLDGEGTGGIAALTDGTFTAGPAGFNQFATPNVGASIQFDLKVDVNAQGYDVSSIQGFGGWQDSGRDRQTYSLYYSVVGSATFSFLGTVDYDPAATGNATIVTSIFDTALTGVDAIRVDFLASQENNHAGYGEFDVIGNATVPEPCSLLLFASAAPLLLRRRRA